jgi:hypothetical protein
MKLMEAWKAFKKIILSHGKVFNEREKEKKEYSNQVYGMDYRGQ